MTLTTLMIAAVSGSLSMQSADRLATIDAILATVQEPDECTCNIALLNETEDPANCNYAYTCTNEAAGEMVSSCDFEIAQADITKAICK
ncbi:hypothetical protein HK107_00975 [Parvularcula sp. ZS-1/3]|uniref:Uncharacterized protein n=1 Tax=Parvularcula mediterranea TaxID=2732508 RepID=A0A7Y3RIT7_9PROT|nr:hypothetical protein [Parvularcula mediterranea]NNU14894.1 hypothetical protein [Parvularcula mediterranea]